MFSVVEIDVQDFSTHDTLVGLSATRRMLVMLNMKIQSVPIWLESSDS